MSKELEGSKEVSHVERPSHPAKHAEKRVRIKTLNWNHASLVSKQ